MVEYTCKREGRYPPYQRKKKELIKEKNKNGNENWKPHYCGHRVY